MKKKVTWSTYFYKGKKEFELCNYKSAIKFFKNAINKETKNNNNTCLTRIYLASTYYFLGDIENAIDQVRVVLFQKDELSQSYLRVLINNLVFDKIDKNKKVDKKKIKDLNKFLKIFQYLIKKTTGHILFEKKATKYLLEIYWMRARLYTRLGNERWALFFFSKAISLIKYKFESNIEEEPYLFEKYDFCTLLGERAFIYIRKRNYKEAIKDINNAILIEKMPLTYFYAGLIYKRLQNYNLSISMLSEAINNLTNKEWLLNSHFLRGFCRVQNENIEEAINDFEIALSIDETCLKDYPIMLRNIPEGIKNIFSIYFQKKF